eukprot:4110952-Pleurochrysis_carterae.AAC.1
MQVLRGAGEGEEAALARAGLLCTIGLMPSLDSARLPAQDVARFIAAAGGDQTAADAVHASLTAALAAGGPAQT